jgi:uncharacterized membrane protein
LALLGSLRLFRETSHWKLGWDVMTCTIALITGLVLPVELLRGFSQSGHLADWWMVFSIIGLIDVGISFNTTIERNGQILRDRRAIARRYLKGMFWPDLLANLPFFLATGLNMQTTAIALLPLLRLPKLLHITERWEDLQLISTAVIRMIRYGMALALITNGVTCLWLWVGLAETGPLGWIQRLQLSRDDFSGLYLHSLYWTVTTLATVGYGDITPKTHLEILLAVLIMITGAVLLALAVGNVVGIISQFDEGQTEHRNRQSAITRYLRINGVEPEIVERIRRFNDYQWSRSRGINPQEMLTDLPSELRSQVTLKILGDAVERVPLLAAASGNLQKILLSALVPITYPPDTVVLEQDAIGEEIVFITRGVVRIDTKEPLPEAAIHYGPGDYLGDLSFFLKERRTAQVISTSYVEAYLLSRSNFEALCQREPKLKELLRRVSPQQSDRNPTLLLAGVIV